MNLHIKWTYFVLLVVFIASCGEKNHATDNPTHSDVCQKNTCAALGKDCGPLADGCGDVLDCGTCGGGKSCGGGGVENVCGIGTCQRTTCSAIGLKYCGTNASDGCGNFLDCSGACVGPETCGANEVANTCGIQACKAKTCANIGNKYCGSVDNGCGQTLDCSGACVAPEFCGDGVNGVTKDQCGTVSCTDSANCVSLVKSDFLDVVQGQLPWDMPVLDLHLTFSQGVKLRNMFIAGLMIEVPFVQDGEKNIMMRLSHLDPETKYTIDLADAFSDMSGRNIYPIKFTFTVAAAPTDLETKRTFITSNKYSGDLGGLAGADAFCQKGASDAGLGGNWLAYLSTSTVNAMDRFPEKTRWTYAGPDHLGLTWEIFKSKKEMAYGPRRSVSLTANGESRLGLVWSGTRNGTGKVAIGTHPDQSIMPLTCNDWTTNESDLNGVVGQSTFTSAFFMLDIREVTASGWTEASKSTCNDTAYLYCIEI